MSLSSDLVLGFQRGDKRALARCVTIVESGGPRAEALLAAVAQEGKRARLLGITGPPGAGKSTLTARVAEIFLNRGESVALLLIDPSSPFTGGAILGDRIRMHAISGRRDLYIRSLGSRGSLGGLSHAVPPVIQLMECFGFDTVIIETVGTGQAETDVVSAVDTVLVVAVPGLGDDVQAMKAGIMEIADVFVVNKADREGAERTVRQVEEALKLQPKYVPVLSTVAITGTGVPELMVALDRHYQGMLDSGELGTRRKARLSTTILTYASSIVSAALADWAKERLAREWPEIESGSIDIFTFARRLAIEFQTKGGRTIVDED